jgi:UDP-GlcNAc:undecaprenyl-phosphate GlcNAc-1-phosphate transferase
VFSPALGVVLGAAGGFIGSAATRTMARGAGIVSKPNPLVPQHVSAVAYLGGVGVLIGLLVAWLGTSAAGMFDGSGAAIVVSACLFCALGTYDDLRPLTPLQKFVAQCAVAAVATSMGLTMAFTGNPIIDGLLTILWFVTIVNAFNLVDVCDGLVTGIAGTTFAVWVAFGPSEAWPVAAAGLGACLGFFPFNAPRASMFLGDAGSHLLGFLVAVLPMLPDAPSLPVHAAQMLMVAAVPLFELLFLIVVRAEKGLPWWRGSPDHFSLRLQAAGWSRWRVGLWSWALAGSVAAAGLALPGVPSTLQFAALAGLLLGGLAIARALRRLAAPSLARQCAA